MSREILDGLLFLLNAFVLAFLLVLVSAPDLIGRAVEWVLS